jgi:hypothetical protein
MLACFPLDLGDHHILLGKEDLNLAFEALSIPAKKTKQFFHRRQFLLKIFQVSD